MNIRTLMLAIVAVLLAASPIGAQVIEGGEESSVGAQPQKTLRYINPLVMEDTGRLADPCVIRHEGKYYLYVTHGISGSIVWSSDDLVQWNFQKIDMPKGAGSSHLELFRIEATCTLPGTIRDSSGYAIHWVPSSSLVIS